MNTYNNAINNNNSFENLVHSENPRMYSITLASLDHNPVSAAGNLLTVPVFTGSRDT
ncbi:MULTISPECIES: hypothetical protein [unclassified Paenibacillus]|uniref:hypothetical protein n=1 Tax=unclassified Paenibacillus TaxID=185978 RepID=UPI00240696C4|nr:MULTISPECIES: hypothetical protein [unclassified Paenibacillus]MDF9842447.1 hypothetical protein [Paenibacillus sp. PastF-2]MDF9849037.1 hypothetical protein [Paenibacillus sp. PastM-2]MDF9855607.1 hypothetical protein [Paenibacillus sp. PastF-1]MDH6480879.1 hypothetical protein [Paenibacillus sp. PastH-2]MDH6508301.1 hypothetical protein [Paenibacillus sp. PastM-3]